MKSRSDSLVIAPPSYEITMAMIAAVGEAYGALEATTPASYGAVVRAIADCRSKRVAVKARHKELKAESLAYGRAVDAAANELIAALEQIEDPLKAKKAAVDESRAATRAAIERAEREAIEAPLRAAAEARVRSEREAAEAQARIEREAAEAELRAERERIVEAHRLAMEQAERERAELQARLVAAQKKAEAEKKAAEAAARAEREAAEAQAERERAAMDAERAEYRRVQQERVEAERAANRAAELLAMAPDAEKMWSWAEQIFAVVDEPPEVTGDVARRYLAAARAELLTTVAFLRTFGRGEP